MSEKCCSCDYWDNHPPTPYGGCMEICKSVKPDQRCSYDMMITPADFGCVYHKIKSKE